jgi:hypothetical protein
MAETVTMLSAPPKNEGVTAQVLEEEVLSARLCDVTRKSLLLMVSVADELREQAGTSHVDPEHARTIREKMYQTSMRSEMKVHI